VCSGCSSSLGSVISGIPGHYIEDVKISNIQVLHAGGGTKEDAAFQPLENEDVYPSLACFSPRGGTVTAVGRTVNSFPKGRDGAPPDSPAAEARRPASSQGAEVQAEEAPAGRRQSCTGCLRKGSTSGT